MKLVCDATSPNKSKLLIKLATFNSAPNKKVLLELNALMTANYKLGFLINLLAITFTATGRPSSGEPTKLLKITPNYDPRIRPWYTAPVLAKKPSME